MADARDVCERLDKRINGCGIGPMLADVDLMRAALAEIRALREENERLRTMGDAASHKHHRWLDEMEAEVARLRSENAELRGDVFAKGIADERRHRPPDGPEGIGPYRRRDADHVAPTTIRASDTTHDSEAKP